MAFVNTLLAIVAIAVCLVIVAWWRARRRMRGAYTDATGALLAPTPGSDNDVRASLQREGLDLSRPIAVRCFLRVPSREGADRVTMLLRSHGFANVRWQARGGEWFVYATTTMVAESGEMATLRANLEGLAHSVGGRYDGWSADECD